MKRGIDDFAKENIRRQVPGIKDRNFFREYLEARWMDYSSVAANDDPDDPPMNRDELFDWFASTRPKFLPDMFYIDVEKRMVYLYEIEDTHPLPREKLERIQDWIEDLGYDEGSFYTRNWYGRVIVTDRYGHNHRMIFAFEHTLGTEPVPHEKINFPFPQVFRPINPA